MGVFFTAYSLLASLTVRQGEFSVTHRMMNEESGVDKS